MDQPKIKDWFKMVNWYASTSGFKLDGASAYPTFYFTAPDGEVVELSIDELAELYNAR